MLKRSPALARAAGRTFVTAALVAVAVAAGAAYATVASDSGSAKLQTRLERIAKLRVPPPANAAALKRAAAAQPPLVPLSGPQEAVPTGILNMGQAPFPTAEYAIENRWQKLLPNGSLLQVYAGAAGDDSRQGLVIVWTVAGNGPPVAFRTPARDGAVRIVAVDGNRFTLSSGDGKRVVFDLATHGFTSG